MTGKEPITREEYDALLKEGLTREQINAEFVIAPTNAGPSKPREQNFGGYTALAQFPRLATNAGAFNMGDRARALLRAMSPKTTYRDALVEEQAKTEKARELAGPAGTLAAELSGSFLVPGVGAASVASKLPMASRIPAVLRNVLAGGAAGAASGALSGAGAAPPGEVLEGAMSGAKVGGALGGALPLAAAGVRQGGRYLGALRESNAREKVAKALGTVVQESGESNVDDYLARRVRPGASGRAVADMDRATQELALDAARGSSKAEQQLQEFAEARKGVQNAALADDARSALGARPVEPGRLSDNIGKTLRRRENRLYAKLWEKYPEAIDDPAFREVWQVGEQELPKYVEALRKNQALAGLPLDDMLMQDGPTLQGAHRVKSAMQSAIGKLQKKAATGSIGEDEDQVLRALTLYQDRLRTAISQTPGGASYDRIQRLGAEARSIQDALEEGQELTRKGTGRYGVQQARERAAQSAAGPRAVEGLRQGVAGDIAQQGRDATRGADAMLNRMSETEATQDLVNELAPTSSNALRFQRDMADRAAMAETNAGQLSRRTSKKEILPGTRLRSTALQFGESSALGAPFVGSNPMSSIGLVLGGLGAKALQGNRAKTTERAAEILSDLLRQSADDPAAADNFRTLEGFLRRLNHDRMTKAARTGATIGSYAAGGSRER